MGRLDTLDPVNLTNLVQRLAKERALFEQIFKTLQEGVLVITSDGIIEYANEAAQRLIGHERRRAHRADPLAADPRPQAVPQRRSRNRRPVRDEGVRALVSGAAHRPPLHGALPRRQGAASAALRSSSGTSPARSSRPSSGSRTSGRPQSSSSPPEWRTSWATRSIPSRSTCS
jgi:PAS domain-containing protein